MSVGADVTEIVLRYDDDWELDLDAVRNALTPRTTLIVVNFPNNPTGYSPSVDTFSELSHLAGEAGARLLSERCTGAWRHRTRHACPQEPTWASTSCRSEAYRRSTGSGARVGWVASHDRRLLDQLRSFRYWTSLSNSVPSEILGLGALRAGERLLKRSQQIVAANTELVAGLVSRHPEELSWVRPRGGTTAYPRLLTEGADALATRLAEKYSVFVAPSSVLLTGGEHLRIGLGRLELEDGLQQLHSALS